VGLLRREEQEQNQERRSKAGCLQNFVFQSALLYSMFVPNISSKHRQVPDQCFYSTPANLPGVRKILVLEPEKQKASNQVPGVE